MEENLKVTSVHDALQNAHFESAAEVAMVNCTFKVPPHVKELAEEICERHGTTMSNFLRQCVKGLVKDYNWGSTEQ